MVDKSQDKIVPNRSCCEGCPQWDDINGCWDDENDVITCVYVSEDMGFDEDEYDKRRGDMIEKTSI